MPSLPDTYDTLRDCRALYLKHLGALLQDSKLLGSGAIQAILQGAVSYFDDMVAATRRGSFQEAASDLTSSRITLVDEDDLELGIRLDHLSATLYETSSTTLWKIHLRFLTLLKRDDLAKTSNPLAPKGVTVGIRSMFELAGAIDLDRKLDLLDKLVKHLSPGLPALYAEIDDFLDLAGIEAAQAGIVTSPESPKKGDSITSTAEGGSLLALQQALLSRLPALNPGGATTQTLGGSSGASSGGAASSLLTQGLLERLLFRLNELDQKTGMSMNWSPIASSNLENLIPGLFDGDNTPKVGPRTLNSTELGIPAAAPEGLAIDTLAMIFEALFSNPALPDTLKAVISSLQITLLKLAMQDATLFTDGKHPARQLIDRMGIAMLGMPVDVAARHPVCTRLFEIAGQLRSEFHGNAESLRTSLTQVDALISKRQEEIMAAAEAYLPMLHQLDRRGEASQFVRQFVDPLLTRAPVVAVRDFIDGPWRRILTRSYLQSGPEGGEWQADSHAIVDLLWTFEPKPTLEDRKALSAKLPSILRRLKSGMEIAGLAPTAQESFLDTFFTLQTNALRGQTAANTNPSEALEQVPAGLPRKPATPMAGEIEAGGRILRTLDFADGQPSSLRPLPCARGDWLRIRDDLNTEHTALFCAQSPHGQRALLLNPDSRFALAVHPVILERQLRDGSARVCSEESLFETAASQALALGQQRSA